MHEVGGEQGVVVLAALCQQFVEQRQRALSNRAEFANRPTTIIGLDVGDVLAVLQEQS